MATVLVVFGVAATRSAPRALAATAAPTEAQTLGPPPHKCEPAGCWASDTADLNDMNNTWVLDFTLSPHLVSQGGEIAGTVSGNDTDSWTWPGIGTTTTPCGSKDKTCTWRMDAATSGWQVADMSISTGLGNAHEGDYYAVIEQGTYLLSGYVRNKEGQGLGGVRLYLTSKKKGSFTTTTDASGYYSALLQKSTYTVWPTGAIYRPGSRGVALTGNQEGVNFELDPNLYVGLKFDAATVPGDGLHTSRGTVTVKDARNELAPDKNINIGPPLTFEPPAIICGPTRRIWPTRFGDGSLSPMSFDRLTDSAGRIDFDVRPGSDFHKNWLVEASVPNSLVLSEIHYEYLNLSGSPGGFVPEFVSTLVSGFQYHPISASAGDSYDAQIQDGTLEALAQMRNDPNVAGALSGVDYAPIHSTDGAGRNHAAILFYPRGADLNAIKAHLGSGGAITAPADTRVLYTSLLQTLVTSRGAPSDLPTLAEYENGRPPPGPGVPPIPAMGPAQAGRLQPQPEEDLTYFGYPYPPALGTSDRADFDSRCLRPIPSQISATVHSPLRLLFRDSQGRRLGVDARGKRYLDVPGGVLSLDKRKRPRAYVLPTGKYKVELFGTGAGRAAIVFSTPGSADDKVRVFNLRSRGGARGSLKVTGKGPGVARLGGRRYAAAKGIGLKATGIPHSLKAGKPKTLKVRVRDQFGKAVAAALLSIKGKGYAVEALADSRGRATVAVKPPKVRSLSARVSAPGHLKISEKIRIKKR